MASRHLLLLPFLMLAASARAELSLADFGLGNWDIPVDQLFMLGTWEGSWETDMGFSNDRTSSGGGESIFTQTDTQNRISIQNNGFSLIDPNFMLGSLGVTLGKGKDVSHTEGFDTEVTSNLLGYSFDAEFLNDLPYGGALFANKSHATTIVPFGFQDNSSSNHGFSLRLNEGSPLKDMGFPYLSADLRVESQDTNQLSTSVLNNNYRFMEHRNSLIHGGHKGGEWSDLDWHYEMADVKQPLSPSASNHSKSAALNYSTDFGEEKNRRWDSRINYTDRVGVSELFDLSTLSVQEALRLSHQSNLSSNYDYQATRVVAQGLPSLTQVASAGIQYQPYQNLSTSANAQHQSLPTSKLDSASGGVGYHYLHELPWEGVLRFNANGSYGRTRQISYNTSGDVGYEPHGFTFDPLAVIQEIPLTQGYVDASKPITVYAVNAKLNVLQATLVACPGTTLSNTPTCDYVIEAPVGNKTAIRVNPLSATLNGLGNNVDTLAVGYSFSVPPNMTYATATSTLGVVLDYRWIVFSLSHNQSEQHLISGPENVFLTNSRQNRAQVDVRGTWQEIQGSGGAAYQTSKDTLVSYDQMHYYGTALYPYSRDLSFGVNADRLTSQYQNPERTNETNAIRLTSTWFPMADASVNGFVGRRSMKDSRQDTETVNEANVRAQLRYGQASVMSSFTINRRVRGPSELNSWRFDVNLVRRL